MRTLILDSNIVLDWLLFNDVRLDALRALLASRRVQVLTHDFAVQELARVLTYPQLKLSAERQAELLTRYKQDTQPAVVPADFAIDNLLLPEHFPRCRDSDDQPFLALCFHAHADALVTHDKALLKLCRRARRFGVSIVDITKMQTLLV